MHQLFSDNFQVVIKTTFKEVNMIKSNVDKCLLLLFLPGRGILYIIYATLPEFVVVSAFLCREPALQYGHARLLYS